MKREGEHSVQFCREIVSMLFIGMQDRFRIGTCPENMTRRLKIPSQLPEIINFPVKNHPNRPVFVKNRLLSAGQIDDRKSPHPDSYSFSDVDPFVVRPAMLQDVTHQFYLTIHGRG